jgi:hypothetical protein
MSKKELARLEIMRQLEAKMISQNETIIILAL